MIKLDEKDIPVLPKQMMVDDECICIGITREGVIIHYIERDIAILMEWSEIVNIGKELEFDVPDTTETSYQKKPKEISKPKGR